MTKKTWKDHLLSSGIPLEHSVRETLLRLRISEIREFKYERPNEQGISTIFSVDIHATYINLNPSLWLEIFIECKYRHDGTRWVFTPKDFGGFFEPSRLPLLTLPTFDKVFVCLDRLTEVQLDRDSLARFSRRYDLCGKGIELLLEDANPKTIEQAVQQLRYAIVARAVEAMIFQVNRCQSRPIFILVPIIVTTAELWRMKPGITIEQIREANDLPEIATQADILFLHVEPDNELIRYTRNAFDSRFTPEYREKLEDYESYKENFAHHCPSLFAVIRYTRLEDSLRNLLSFFRRPPLVQAALDSK